MTTNPTSEEARLAVNVFVSIDILGLLDHKESRSADSIEEQIKSYYLGLDIPENEPLKTIAKQQPLQEWDKEKKHYVFNSYWNVIIEQAHKNSKENYKVFSNSPAVQDILGKYVRLIASRGDTQGWKLAIDKSDLITESNNVTYLTETYNLSIKAKPNQWIRWWGNSITPFCDIQCVVANITTAGRPTKLEELENEHYETTVYMYPSGSVGKTPPEYVTAQSRAYSYIGQLKPGNSKKINYDITFHLVDHRGDIIAEFRVDPEIRVI
ncbi:AidA/PixA family protein [Moorena sp. SIO3I6]|uniref:AidA/PixA family protein n=1 Tax=Moorena sp. SIO3I6 TaxID=2607831 RepID=UPI0013F9F59D|nr:AidA/PixA family protein [Moorena sp. SIO3I6]NEP23809.1 hypothetical protein [Moorena sp. SIO3I6]